MRTLVAGVGAMVDVAYGECPRRRRVPHVLDGRVVVGRYAVNDVQAAKLRRVGIP